MVDPGPAPAERIADTPANFLARGAHLHEALDELRALMFRQGDYALHRLFKHAHQGRVVALILDGINIEEIEGLFAVKYRQLGHALKPAHGLPVVRDCLLGLRHGVVLLPVHVREDPPSEYRRDRL
jgi:hypothetical protein